MAMKSPVGTLGVALLALSVVGCGFGGFAQPKKAKASSTKACNGFRNYYHSVDEALAALRELPKKRPGFALDSEVSTVAFQFDIAALEFNPQMVYEPMSDSVKTALTRLHDSMERVSRDLVPKDKGAKLGVQAAFSDGEEVSRSFSALQEACGPS